MIKENFKKINRIVNKVFNIFRTLPKGMAPGSPVTLSSKVVWIQLLDTRPFEVSRISLLFGTFQRKNKCSVEIQLFSSEYEILHHEILSGELLGDNVPYELKLSKDFAYRGQCFVVIGSPDATSDNCVALWTRPELENAGLRAVPRLGRDISSFMPNAQGAVAYPGIAFVNTLGRNSGAHAFRTYLRHDGKLNGSNRRIEAVGVIGFSEEQIQTLFVQVDLTELKLYTLTAKQLDQLAECNVLLMPATFDIEEARSLAKFARRKQVPVFLVEIDNGSIILRNQKSWSSFSDGLISNYQNLDSRLPQVGWDDGVISAAEKLLGAFIERRQPKVSIVTILSGKVEQLRPVIESYFNQTYSGEIEVIYINDCFGEGAESVVAMEFELKCKLKKFSQINYKVMRNAENIGNCGSRNKGIAEATGDIVIIIDADCMLNPNFIAAHVDAHSYLDCEVVIGPHNIETNGAPPLTKLAEMERSPFAALESSDLQAPKSLDTFLNCITRNFSIKKSAVKEELFDLDFTYSLAPDSGFGWEDVEMGYRLYKQGLGIKFTEDAYSIHISHASSISEIEKPKKSIKNFHKLFVKHPELCSLARLWAVQTLDKLDNWSAKIDPNHHENTDLITLRRIFSDAPRLYNSAMKRNRKLRILTYRWHVPHQYELYKSDHDFFLVKGTGTSMCDQWEYAQRPLPANASFIEVDDIRESEFDMAILHFDENVLSPENTNGKIGEDWGAAFRYFVKNINLPKVAVCHGTPQFYGQYTPGYNKSDLMTPIEHARKLLVEYVKNIEIVCNSYQAQREWGFHKSRVIWHGFDPSEFLQATYKKGILSPQGPLVNSRPHYRGFYLYQQVFSTDFPKEFLPETLSVPNPDIDYVQNVFAVAKYKNYIDQIRQYSVYFNPTLRSPMPRARCEPMMCGVVTVNANNHDVDMFIKNGVNGFYSNDPEELRDNLIYLMKNPDVTRQMGYEARTTAMNVFNYDRYLSDWANLLKSTV